MKKNACVIYICITIFVCIIPFAAMTYNKTETTSENKLLKDLPEIVHEYGRLNVDYMSELGDYFDERFAYRPELVSLNGVITSILLHTSTVEDVIVGKNDWLYYSATLDDFRHDNSESERMIYNIAHNVKLMQDYCDVRGIDFVFTIAPNKNSLYGDCMPDRYNYICANESDAARLKPYLEEQGVSYVDMFELFGKQDEVLYYRKDSHWNNKGAVLAYNALLDKVGREHFRYDYEPEIVYDYVGDLNNMLYANLAKPEMDYKYVDEFQFTYINPDATVEDNVVETVNKSADGSLLMYRDSFGNALLPYMASGFGRSYFSKVVPYLMADVDMVDATVLIVEKVERHLPTLAKVPPIMEAVKIVDSNEYVPCKSEWELSIDGDYIKITGTVSSDEVDVNAPIYIKVIVDGTSSVYSAFCLSNKETDYGYVAYLPGKGELQGISVLTILTDN